MVPVRRILFRIVKIALVLVLVLVLVVGGLLSWLVVRGFPQRDGTARIAGLSAQVRVLRDENGIANIYASSTEDLFAAQGYVHASERMWQMEVWRRIGAGRLAELFGDDQVATDRYVRTLGWRKSAEADWQVMSVEGKTALEAYTRGVNAWLDTHADLPLPFVVTGLQGAGGGLSGFRPEPWTPVDTLTWAKVQAWSLGDNMGNELLRMVLLKRGLTTEQIAELNPVYDPSRPVVAPASGGTGFAGPARRVMSTPTATHLTAAAAGSLMSASDNLRSFIALAGAGPALAGSNAFAIAPSRSATGAALLANDPHLDISMPSVWYLVGLHCRPVGPRCPYELAGAGFPGVPGIVLGHNARIAWGLTNVGPDVEDLFEERVDLADITHYMYKNESRPFEVRHEVIKVSGGADVPFDVRSTVHGAVISDVETDLQPGYVDGPQLGREGYVYTLAWTATMQPDRTLDSVLAVNRAQDWDEFRAALRYFGAPSQTFVYADVDGNIGVQIPGLFPIRASGDGAYPVSGEDGSHDWTGFVPFDELPFVYNPPDGVIVAANNMPADSSYGHFLGQEFDPGFRAARIRELLGGDAALTVDDLRRIQGDVMLTRAAPVVNVLRDVKAATADGELLRERLVDWGADQTGQLGSTPTKLECATNSLGCAGYEDFEYWLLRGVFGDELGSGYEAENAAWRYVGTELSHELIGRMVSQPDSKWWDDTSTTDKTETRDQVIAAALDRAAGELRSALGDPQGWTWGRLHTATFREQTLGESGIAPLEWIFNRGPYPVSGSCTTVNKTCGWIASDWPMEGDPPNFARRFGTVSAPSYRLVIDMGKIDDATILQTTGQSGLPFDAHYGDLIGRWLSNDPVPLRWTDDRVEAGTKQTLILNP
jgi:penicillin amidase